MKYNDLPDFTAMTIEEVEDVCENIGIDVIFNDLSNGRHEFPLKRVVRYKIKKKESGEVIVCDITGFPTLNYEQKTKE